MTEEAQQEIYEEPFQAEDLGVRSIEVEDVFQGGFGNFDISF